MASWLKPIIIFVMAISSILLFAKALDWPVTLIVPGIILGLLATLWGITDNSVASRREAGFNLLLSSAIIFFVVFFIEQIASFGFRAMIAGVLMCEGVPATKQECFISLSLIAEMILCVFLIRYIPVHEASEAKAFHENSIGVS